MHDITIRIDDVTYEKLIRQHVNISGYARTALQNLVAILDPTNPAIYHVPLQKQREAKTIKNMIFALFRQGLDAYQIYDKCGGLIDFETIEDLITPWIRNPF